MPKMTQLALGATLFLAGLSQFAAAVDINYAPYCPTVSALQLMPFAPNQSYYWTGTNHDGLEFKANTELPQYIFTKSRIPKIESLNTSLTHFNPQNQRLNCTYNLTNHMDYAIPYPIYNQGGYHECPNGALALTGKACTTPPL